MNDTGKAYDSIVALRNEKGSYNCPLLLLILT